MAPSTLPALDAILKAQAARHPNRLALVDPPDCERTTGQFPRRFTYRQADRAIGAIAARLREIGLAPGAVVGVQMPNIAASIVTLLAIMRAGMIAAPLPLLWRRSDCVAALSAASARAIVICGRVAGFDHAALARDVAAELFPIRAVCGFDCAGADGVVAFDELLSAGDEHPDSILFDDTAFAGLALVTFETTSRGLVPVARDTAQLLTAGELIRQRGDIGPNAVILSTIPASSFAGISTALTPWLLTGGTLALHHPFDADSLRQQMEHERCNTLVLPAAVLPCIGTSGGLDPQRTRTVIALWRAPERVSGAAQWTSLDVALVDVAAFGETALLAARRPPGGRTVPWPTGPLRIADGATPSAHVAQMPGGTLGICGALAASPFRPYDTGAVAGMSAGSEYIDTGFPCRLTADENACLVTAPPADLVAVGGYHFAMQDLQRTIGTIDSNAVLAAFPHALTGHRLAGHAENSVAMRAAFEAMGVNPLLTAAFRDRAA